MSDIYQRGEVVSVANPYAETKPRSAIILTDDRRPLHDDGQMRYTIVLLTGALEEFEAHDWTVKLDAQQCVEPGQPPLRKDSLIEPWAHYVVRDTQITGGPFTKLNTEALKDVSRAYVRMLLK